MSAVSITTRCLLLLIMSLSFAVKKLTDQILHDVAIGSMAKVLEADVKLVNTLIVDCRLFTERYWCGDSAVL